MSKPVEKGVRMFAGLSNLDRGVPTARAAVVVAAVGAAALLGAWFFQYVIGLSPCPLCMEQRIAYYFVVPLAAMVALGISVGATPKVIQLAMFAIAIGMLWNAGLGVYHSGIEWRWWPGPQECTGTPSFGNVNDLQERLKNMVLVRCDEAQWRFLGLSLAGYNALISLGLSAVAFWGAISVNKTRPAGIEYPHPAGVGIADAPVRGCRPRTFTGTFPRKHQENSKKIPRKTTVKSSINFEEKTSCYVL